MTGPIAFEVPRSWSGLKWSATTAQTLLHAARRALAEVAADDQQQVGGEDLRRELAAQLGRPGRERVLGEVREPPHVVAERARADLARRHGPALLDQQRQDGRERHPERALAGLEREPGRERRRARVGRREPHRVGAGADGGLAGRAVPPRPGGRVAQPPGRLRRVAVGAGAAVGEPVRPRRRIPGQQRQEHALGLRHGDVAVLQHARPRGGQPPAGVERAGQRAAAVRHDLDAGQPVRVLQLRGARPDRPGRPGAGRERGAGEVDVEVVRELDHRHGVGPDRLVGARRRRWSRRRW